MSPTRRQLLGGAAAVTAASLITEVNFPNAAEAATTGDPTTLTGTVIPQAPDAKGWRTLARGPGESYWARTELVTSLTLNVTRSLTAFVQMSDLHVVDDQSPLRVEWLDTPPGGAGPSHTEGSAYRPQEFLSTQLVEAMVRGVRKAVRGPRTNLPFAFTICTGDVIDNCQYNETRWYIDLLDGGKTIVPDSGQIGRDESVSRQFGRRVISDLPHDPKYWDPDLPPVGQTIFPTDYDPFGFGRVSGLRNAARQPFTSTGLGMPWYTAFGNHDRAIQGNLPIDFSWTEDIVIDVDPHEIAVGTRKSVGTEAPLPANPGDFDWADLMNNLVEEHVTADPERRLLDQDAFIAEHRRTAGLPVGHGFGNTNRSFYTFADPGDVIHYITLDSTKRLHSDGQISAFQLDWLEEQLIARSSKYMSRSGFLTTQPGVDDKLIVIFCHHTIDSIENGALLKGTLHRFPNVILMVNGHTHANKITPHARPAGSPFPGGFWEINTASHIDWPIQSRIIEIATSVSGATRNLAIFTTMIDIDAPIEPSGSGPDQLASWGRQLAVNDPIERPANRRGEAEDRNTLLLLPQPFRVPPHLKTTVRTPVTSVARRSDRTDIFAVGRDGRTMTNWWDTQNGWAGWEPFGGGVLARAGSEVSVVRREGTRLDGYMIGADGLVYTATSGFGPWSPWVPVAPLTCRPDTGIAVVSRSEDHIDLFAIGMDGRVMSTWWNRTAGWATTWFQVASGGAAAATKVTAIARNVNRIDVFAVGNDHRPYSVAWDAATGWGATWTVRGTQKIRPGSGITVVARDATKMDLFSVNENGQVVSTWWNTGVWASDWFALGGTVPIDGSDVAVVTRDVNHLDLFVVDTGKIVRSMSWSASAGWSSSWFAISGTPVQGERIGAISRAVDRIDLFTVDGAVPRVRTVSWTSVNGWITPFADVAGA